MADEKKYKVCPRCDGMRMIPDPNDPTNVIDCPKCNGEGVVDKDESDDE